MVITRATLTLPEREAKWNRISDAILEIIPDSLIVPMGWQKHDTGLVVTTIEMSISVAGNGCVWRPVGTTGRVSIRPASIVGPSPHF